MDNLGETVAEDAEEFVVQMLKHLDFLLADGSPLGDAEKTVAAARNARPALADEDMKRIRKALAGYRKAKPPRSRPPLAPEIMAGIVNIGLARGLRDEALQVLTQFSTYGRPSEVRDLRKGLGLIPPVRCQEAPALGLHVVSFAPQEDDPEAFQSTTKTGVIDDCVILDNPVWLGPVLEDYSSHVAWGDQIFSTTARENVEAFTDAGNLLGLPELCQYQLRHGGASNDLLTKLRSEEGVRGRGRWKGYSSVRRYGKPAQVQRA